MRDKMFAAGAIAALSLAGSASAGVAGGGGTTLVLADSQLDYGGSQGENGWFYGYYDGNMGAASYTPDDFELMNVYDEVNDRWWVDNSPSGPLTLIDAEFMHPNAFIAPGMSDSVEWAARRWVSSFSGTVNIGVDLERGNPEFAGDGFVLRLFIDGLETLAVEVFANNDAGVSFDLAANITEGSTIDFAIDPLGNAVADAARFRAIISTNVPTPGALACLGLGGLIAARRRR